MAAKKGISSPPDYRNWPRENKKISDLFLDPENVRLGMDVRSSQDALINDLFLNEDAMQVLESIILNGFFPDELPVVIKEKGRFTVIEGNRRVAALKVLIRPEIVPAKEPRIRDLLKNRNPRIRDIDVVVAPDRTSLEQFLASKHTQNTRRRWRPLRQAYFYKAQLDRGKSVQDLRNEYPNVNIEKFLRLINVHRIAKSISYETDQISRKVHNERTFPASTVERLYEDKNVRDFLGFDFDKDGDVKINIAKKEFEKGFKKIVQDVVEKVVDSRSLNNEKNRKEYLTKVPEEYVPKRLKGTKTLSSSDFKEKNIIPKKRTHLAPKDILFNLQSPGVRRMLEELQNINYNKFPNASHDLLRSFLECALKAYFDHRGTSISPSSSKPFVYLNDVLQEFKTEMDKAKNRQLSQLTQRIISSNKMTAYSAQFLNATNHNPSVFAVPTDVEEAWDTMEKLFRFILNPK